VYPSNVVGHYISIVELSISLGGEDMTPISDIVT